MRKIRIDEQNVGYYFWTKAPLLYRPAFFFLRLIKYLPFVEVYNSYKPEILPKNVIRLSQYPKYKRHNPSIIIMPGLSDEQLKHLIE